MNVFKTLATVAACYVICWTLNQFSYLTFNLGLSFDHINSTFHSVTIIMVFINSCVNPVIYCIRYEQVGGEKTRRRKIRL